MALTGEQAYALARKYTDVTVEGGGALKGKNCTISSITEIEGGHRVTFEWMLDDGTVQTDTMDVMDGEQGPQGEPGADGSVVTVTQSLSSGTKIGEIDVDGTTTELFAPAGGGSGAVDSVNGKTGNVVLTASDVNALPNTTSIPSKTSDLTNDSNFVADASYVHTDNNYDTTAKNIVDGVTSALADKVDKVTGKGLSTNDYSNADKSAVDALGNASVKDITTFVSPNNHDIPDANAIYTAMTAMMDGAFHPAGNKTCAELTSDLLVLANVGNVYKITDSGVTDANWVGGAGQTITANDMAVVVYGNQPDTFLFNLENGISIDLNDYQTKAITPITVDGHTKSNVEDAVDAINVLAGSNKTAISGIKDGTNIDSFADVETALASKADKTAITNPNLLDNPWFTVNQRGATSWSSGYGVDRWVPQRADITVNADKTLTVTPTELSTNNGYIGQRIEKENSLLGKTVTISALLSNGTITSHTFDTIEDAINNAVEGNYNFGYSTITSSSYDLVWFGLRSNSTISSVTIKAIKLELGSVSTLAMDAAPNYASELLKCQRYFYAFNGKPSLSGHSYAIIGTGYATSANNIRVPFYLPVEMRIVPTVSVSALSDVVIMSEVADSAAPSAIAIDSASCDRNNIGLFNITSDGNFVKGHSASVYTKNGCRIDLSADL